MFYKKTGLFPTAPFFIRGASLTEIRQHSDGKSNNYTSCCEVTEFPYSLGLIPVTFLNCFEKWYTSSMPT